jgi:hypothetical protein
VTRGADGKTGPQDRTAHHPRRSYTRVPEFKQALHALEHVRLDDRRSLGEDVLGFALVPFAPGLTSVEGHPPL